jgi:hypothetical protein
MIDPSFRLAAGNRQRRDKDIGIEDRFQRRNKRTSSRSESTAVSRARSDRRFAGMSSGILPLDMMNWMRRSLLK